MPLVERPVESSKSLSDDVAPVANLLAADVPVVEPPRWTGAGLSWDDEGQVQFPLQRIFLSVTVACLAMGAFDIARAAHHGVLTNLGAITVMLTATVLHRRKKIRAAITIALWGMSALVGTMMLTAPLGVHDLSISVFPAVLIVGACLFSPSEYIVFSVVIVAGIGALSWLDMNRIWMRSQVPSSWDTLLDLVVIFSLTALAAGLVARSLRTALARSRARATELERKNAFIEQQKLEIERLLGRAEEASRLKGEFLANMSHEIRTPMNAILGLSELASQETDAARQKRNCRTIHEAAGALLTVINDILDLSAVEAGKLRIEKSPFALRECVEGVVTLLRWRAEEKGLRLELEIEQTVPACVSGDAGRIRQILMNLAGNAVKFTEQGLVRIRVSCRRADPKIAHIVFAVSDTGIGIPENELGRIFDAFTQLDGSAQRRQGGTGLGLTISSRLAAHMGGRIEVQSQPGRGSTFEFSVPLVIADCVPPKAEAALQNTRPLRILLAEDNRINRHIASQMLERLGHSVSIAENGCKALELSAAESFDAVLMDIQMPELDGLAATRAIRERESTGGPRLPIIALTAHAMSGDEAECLGAGMDAYLSKPIQQDALRQVLARFAAPPPQDRTINTGAFTP